MGGLIARSIAQDCPIKGKVRNLVTVGTPNMGITGLPACGSAEIYEASNDLYSYMMAMGCGLLNVLAKQVAYSETIRDLSGTGYFRDVDNIDTYLEKSSFLAELNNEVIHPKNQQFREKVIKLNAAVFIQWDSDEVLYPRETSMFDQLSPANGKLKHSKNKLHYHYRGDDEIQIEPLDEAITSTLYEFE